MTGQNGNQSAIDQSRNRTNGERETSGDGFENAVEDFGKAALDRISDAIKDVTVR